MFFIKILIQNTIELKIIKKFHNFIKFSIKIFFRFSFLAFRYLTINNSYIIVNNIYIKLKIQYHFPQQSITINFSKFQNPSSYPYLQIQKDKINLKISSFQEIMQFFHIRQVNPIIIKFILKIFKKSIYFLIIMNNLAMLLFITFSFFLYFYQ